MPPAAPPGLLAGLSLQASRFGQAAELGNPTGGGGADPALVGGLCALGGFIAGIVLIVSLVKILRMMGKDEKSNAPTGKKGRFGLKVKAPPKAKAATTSTAAA